jgi:hypothetical protein
MIAMIRSREKSPPPMTLPPREVASGKLTLSKKLRAKL